MVASEGGWALAIVPLVALTGLWLVATILNVGVVQQAALPILLTCWGLSVFGLGAAGVLLPVTATFLLAIPFWEVLIPPLQLLTIVVNEILLFLVRIPADVQGEIITIPAGSFQVAESCAGLIYFMVAMVVGVLYAHLFVKRWRIRLAILALAATTALVSNWVRVLGLVIIGHLTDMQSSLMTGHHTYGWIIFTIALVPFFVLARRVEQWFAVRSEPVADQGLPHGALPTSTDEPIDADDAGLGGLWSSRDAILRRAILTSAVALIGPVLYFGYGSLPESGAAGYEVAALTDAGSSWEVTPESLERPFTWQPNFTGAAERQTASLTDGEAQVYLDQFTYRDQVQGAELIQGANRIAPRDLVLQERVNGPVDRTGRFVREAVVQTEQGPILVWYWYRVAGVDTSSPALAKLLELVAFVRRHREAELIALSSPCGEDSCLSAFEALVTLFGGEPPS